MKISYLSPSALKKIELCEARALAQKEDDTYDEGAKHEGTLAGILAHAACKHWFRPNPAWDQAIMALPNKADRIRARQFREINGIHKHVITDPDMAFKIAIQEVAGDKELPREAASVQDARALFETIIAQYKRDQINVIFAERRIMGPLDPVGVPVHLIIDLAIDNGGVMDIIDFKTGFIPIENEEMWSDHQVLMNLTAMGMVPEYDYYTRKAFSFFWVRLNQPSHSISLTPEQASDYLYWMMFEYDRILKLDANNVRESINRFCESCGRKYQCTAYQRLVADAFAMAQPMTEEQLRGLTPQQIMEQHERIKQQAKIMEASQDVIKNMLDVMIRSDNPSATTLAGTTLMARRRQSKRSSPDTGTVISQAMRRNIPLHTLVSAKGKEHILKAFQGDPEALAQIEATMIESRTAPWIEVVANPDAKPRSGKSKVKKEAA